MFDTHSHERIITTTPFTAQLTLFATTSWIKSLVSQRMPCGELSLRFTQLHELAATPTVADCVISKDITHNVEQEVA